MAAALRAESRVPSHLDEWHQQRVVLLLLLVVIHQRRVSKVQTYEIWRSRFSFHALIEIVWWIFSSITNTFDMLSNRNSNDQIAIDVTKIAHSSINWKRTKWCCWCCVAGRKRRLLYMTTRHVREKCVKDERYWQHLSAIQTESCADCCPPPSSKLVKSRTVRKLDHTNVLQTRRKPVA